jgi:hypothetical protein
MSVTQIRNGGTVVGFRCQFGHNHITREEADICDPAKYAANQSAQQRELAANRRVEVANSKDFKPAIQAAKQLGAAEADAEEVVLVNGCERVLAVRDSLAGLGIGRIKAAKKADEKPAA